MTQSVSSNEYTQDLRRGEARNKDIDHTHYFNYPARNARGNGAYVAGTIADNDAVQTTGFSTGYKDTDAHASHPAVGDLLPWIDAVGHKDICFVLSGLAVAGGAYTNVDPTNAGVSCRLWLLNDLAGSAAYSEDFVMGTYSSALNPQLYMTSVYGMKFYVEIIGVESPETITLCVDYVIL